MGTDLGGGPAATAAGNWRGGLRPGRRRCRWVTSRRSRCRGRCWWSRGAGLRRAAWALGRGDAVGHGQCGSAGGTLGDIIPVQLRRHPGTDPPAAPQALRGVVRRRRDAEGHPRPVHRPHEAAPARPLPGRRVVQADPGHLGQRDRAPAQDPRCHDRRPGQHDPGQRDPDRHGRPRHGPERGRRRRDRDGGLPVGDGQRRRVGRERTDEREGRQHQQHDPAGREDEVGGHGRGR